MPRKLSAKTRLKNLLGMNAKAACRAIRKMADDDSITIDDVSAYFRGPARRAPWNNDGPYPNDLLIDLMWKRREQFRENHDGHPQSFIIIAAARAALASESTFHCPAASLFEYIPVLEKMFVESAAYGCATVAWDILDELEKKDKFTALRLMCSILQSSSDAQNDRDTGALVRLACYASVNLSDEFSIRDFRSMLNAIMCAR